MKTHAQAVVIGGGVIGCSILYHLTKLGWRDVILLERDELTSGSTWHAAAGIHGLHDSTNISKIQHYTMKFYKELEVETGQGCGVFQSGSLYLAQTSEREDQLRLQAAKALLYGMNFHEISLDEAKALHPLVNYDGVRCIMWEPDGGHVDPSGVTNAYAAGARQNGAEIYRFTPVAATLPQLDHQLPAVADRDGKYYMRQEGQGLLVGAYERDVRFWAEHGTPPGFGHELFSDDLDRIEDNMLRAIDRVPALGVAGIKRLINGPMIWSPDSNVLFGPVPELGNYFCCNGVIPGFSQSGGMGLLAAEWIIEGETKYDMFA